MHGETVKKNLFNTLPANVENMVSSNNASKGQMGFNWVFKWLKKTVTIMPTAWSYQ